MAIKTYTKNACVKIMDIAFKVTIFFAILGFVFKLINGTQGGILEKNTPLSAVFKQALAMNSDALFSLAAYTVCLTPFILAIAIIIGYCAEKRPKNALLGVLLFAVLIMAFTFLG